MQPFDLRGPLPTGTTLLEASAGTGKTFTVGALVTRYVAEGVARLDELLVITFGRAASQELRERVRAALVEAERAFSWPDDPPPNEVVALLLDADETERRLRHQRLRDALAEFDAATIATTHQFCQLVLRSLGVAGDTDAGSDLVESLDDLVVEVVEDLYLQWFGQQRERPPFDATHALMLARTAIEDPQARLAHPGEADDTARARVDFAVAVRAEVERRKRRLGLLSYDDLLSRLRDALRDPDAPARDRMRQRWQIVLVDEFQDTDPVQWQVLDYAFSGHARMVLIGDPKQAIYGFRGGDVETYLTAASAAETRATLGVNWRSDGDLVERLQVVLGGAALGDPRIQVHDVAARHGGSRLSGAPHPDPFRMRQVPRTGFRLSKSKLIRAADARGHIAEDCAADIAELLGSEATWDGNPVIPGQIAVIVATRNQGGLVQQALQRRGVQAVMAGGGDVFQSPAADQWAALLEAMDAPHRSGMVRAAALTSFFGYTVPELDTGGDDLTGAVSDTLRGWALLLRGRGVAALVEAAEERGLTARVLSVDDGERLLTDLRHLGQVLHERSVRDRLGLTALLEWFRAERSRSGSAGSHDRPRRLDSDAAAVQIVTVHGSKGLQYPVVYLPFLFEFYLRDPEVARFHEDEPGSGKQRTIDLSGGGEHWESHARQHVSEELGEELRQLYVALTRAQSQVVAWWAPTANTATGALHRILFGRRPGDSQVPDQQEVGDDAYAGRVLGLIGELGGPAAEVSTIVPPVPVPDHGEPGELEVRRFGRSVDTEWRRTSYSGLIRIEESAPVGSEVEEGGTDDEDESALLEQAEADAAEAAAQVTSPMAELPAGATFGSLVHAVLEFTDPDASDLREELLTHTRDQLRWWPVEASASDLADALVPLNHTSLGPLAGGLSLGEIPLRDRLRELDFEIPLAGGDLHDLADPGRASTDAGRVSPDAGRACRDQHSRLKTPQLRDIAPLLRHHLAPDDPMVSYADRLETPPLADQSLSGYLSGSVDVVLRLPDGRFLVVDYKTNHLGDTAADYGRDELTEAMLHSHYPLQALLYSAVVHRFLRWRLPGYDPATHLGGVLYLYVRGMCGPDTPEVDGHPAGVFSWQPPPDLAIALSDLLDGKVAP